jgi:hypothetical protein
MDLAAAEAGRVPDDLLKDKAIGAKLPILFRVLRRGGTKGEIDAVVRKLKGRDP